MLCNDEDFTVTVAAAPEFLSENPGGSEETDITVIKMLLQGLETVGAAQETEGIHIQVRDSGTGELLHEKVFIRETDLAEKE